MEAAARQLPHRHRLMKRPRGRRARLVDRLAVEPGQDAHRVHVRKLALAGPHADGRVALEQLDVVVAFLVRVDEVGQVQVLVEIDEILLLGVIEDRIRVTWRWAGWIGRGGIDPVYRPRSFAASSPAQRPSASWSSSLKIPFTRPAANTLSGSERGTNCSTGST